MIKHIPYNPYMYAGANTGQPSPVELIPEGFVLEKVVPISEYEWVMVVRKDEKEPLCHCIAKSQPHKPHEWVMVRREDNRE